LWESYTDTGKKWFEGHFYKKTGAIAQASDVQAGQWLEKLFAAIESQRPGFLAEQKVSRIVSQLDFPRDWGLGSSSTLVAALAQWSQTDPFLLLGKSFGGSGYDLACATSETPLLFQRQQRGAHWVKLPYQPAFSDQLYFIYLGQKQDSREGIKRYRALGGAPTSTMKEISQLSLQFIQAQSLRQVQSVIDRHETLISQVIQLPKVKAQRFADFPGSIKSLGAWGGDFILAATDLGKEQVAAYFAERSCQHCFSWSEMSLPNHT
jgi:mevalonate kinase